VSDIHHFSSAPNGAASLQASQHIDQHRLRAAIGLVFSGAGVRQEAADLSVTSFLFEFKGICGTLGRQPFSQTDTEIDLLVTPADFLQEAAHRCDLRLGIFVVVPIAAKREPQIDNLILGQHAVNVSVELTAPLFKPAIVANLDADGVRMEEPAVVFTQVVRPALIGETFYDLAVVGRISPGACVADNELGRDTPANVIVPRTNRGIRVVGPGGEEVSYVVGRVSPSLEPGGGRTCQFTGVPIGGQAIACWSCGALFAEEVSEQLEGCPVCGEPLGEHDELPPEEELL
jgi:hypothetical protein